MAVIPSRQYLVWLLAESGGCLAGIKTTNMAAKAVVAEARALTSVNSDALVLRQPIVSIVVGV